MYEVGPYKVTKTYKLLDFYWNNNCRKMKMDYLAKRCYEDSTVKPIKYCLFWSEEMFEAKERSWDFVRVYVQVCDLFFRIQIQA